MTHNLFQTFRFFVYIFVYQIKYSRYVICFLNMRFTLYLIFIVTNDVNFTFVIANDQRIKKNKIVVNSWRFHFQHEISINLRRWRFQRNFLTTMTMTKSFSRFQHNKIFRFEFCENKWHSIKRFVSINSELLVEIRE